MLNVGHRRLFVAALLVPCVAAVFRWSASSTHAQQPTPQAPRPPVFRDGTTFVSVDVYPRRDGVFVDGLTANDFQIFEDGVRQTVETFQIIRNEPNPADSERRDPNTKADGDTQAADPRNRVFVVYLDLLHTTVPGSHYARQPVVDFLTRTIGRHDLFGVLTQEVPVRDLVFVRRTETLEAELAKYWPWGQLDRVGSGSELRTPLEERLGVCEALMRPDRPGAPLVAMSRDDLLMTSLEHLVRRLGDLRDERKNVLFISEGWVPRGPRLGLTNVSMAEGDLPKVGVGPGGRLGMGETMQPHMEDRAWCDSEIARLGTIDFTARFRQLLTSAAQANVSFYPVDVGGLRGAATRATDTLRELAENTDGFAVQSTNDLVGGVRRINDDLSAHYLLGYYTTNPAANGRFRQIDVRVNQPGVRISARRGYLAPTADVAAAAGAPPPDTERSAVDAAIALLASARADAEISVAGAPTPQGLRVAVELSPVVVQRAAWRPGAAVQVLATRADGVNLSATMEIAAGERSAATVMPWPDTAGGSWQVVLQATSGAERLQQRIDVAADVARIVGPAVAWRGMPSPRVPLKPLADPRLTRGERLRVEWALVAPSDRRVARLLDRTGKPLGQPLPFAVLPAERQALAIDLPLASLTEGDYLVELVASRGDDSERRLLPFRVVR